MTPWRSLSSALAVLVLLAAGPAGAQTAVPQRPPSILDDYQFQEQMKQGLGYLYDMDFAGADAVFADIASRYPGHPVSPFLQALVPWWTIPLEPDDTSQDAAFFAAMDEVLRRCEAGLAADPEDIDAMFFQTAAHAFRGRLHSDRRKWLKAARDGQKALKWLREVRQRDPDNRDLDLGVGAFYYLADVVPKQHRILRPFARLFPRGDRQRGLQDLERAMNEGRFVQAEAAYTLLQVHYMFEKDYTQSLRYTLWLRQRYPGNSLFQLYEGRNLERLGRLGQARLVFQDIVDRHGKGQSGYTDSVAEQALYVLSRAEMHHRQYAPALAHLEQLEQLMARRPLNTEYRMLGRLRHGMALDALGRREEAVRCYRTVMEMKWKGETHDYARQRARTYLKKPFRGEQVRVARR